MQGGMALQTTPQKQTARGTGILLHQTSRDAWIKEGGPSTNKRMRDTTHRSDGLRVPPVPSDVHSSYPSGNSLDNNPSQASPTYLPNFIHGLGHIFTFTPKVTCRRSFEPCATIPLQQMRIDAPLRREGALICFYNVHDGAWDRRRSRNSH